MYRWFHNKYSNFLKIWWKKRSILFFVKFFAIDSLNILCFNFNFLFTLISYKKVCYKKEREKKRRKKRGKKIICYKLIFFFSLFFLYLSLSDHSFFTSIFLLLLKNYIVMKWFSIVILFSFKLIYLLVNSMIKKWNNSNKRMQHDFIDVRDAQNFARIGARIRGSKD